MVSNYHQRTISIFFSSIWRAGTFHYHLVALSLRDKLFSLRVCSSVKIDKLETQTEWPESLCSGTRTSPISGLFCDNLQSNVLEWHQRVIKLDMSWTSYLKRYFLSGGETEAQKAVFTFLEDELCPDFPPTSRPWILGRLQTSLAWWDGKLVNK